MLLYSEALQRNTPADSRTRARLRDELNRAFKMITALVPTMIGRQRCNDDLKHFAAEATMVKIYTDTNVLRYFVQPSPRQAFLRIYRSNFSYRLSR
jgi:hypothetical protein